MNHVRQPQLRDLIVELGGHLRPGTRESIRRQLQVPLGEDLATLLVSVTLLHDEAGAVLGSVVVLDDYTQPVKLQRMLAWREVASRIAHEIKNPLTPIQLSAQRLRRRFRARFEATPDDVKVFDDCVEVMDTNPLGPPGPGDRKVYCPGVGLTIDEDIELVDFRGLTEDDDD